MGLFERIFEQIVDLFVRICDIDIVLFGVEFKVVSVYVFIGLFAIGLMVIKGLGDK